MVLSYCLLHFSDTSRGYKTQIRTLNFKEEDVYIKVFKIGSLNFMLFVSTLFPDRIFHLNAQMKKGTKVNNIFCSGISLGFKYKCKIYSRKTLGDWATRLLIMKSLWYGDFYLLIII